MTPADHAALALWLVDGREMDPRLTLEQRIAMAQVHATLALVKDREPTHPGLQRYTEPA